MSNEKINDYNVKEELKNGEETNADKKQELLNVLLEKGRQDKNQLTYSTIADVLESTDLDKNQVDDLYEALMSKGIEIVSETEPGDFELMLSEENDAEGEDELMVDESGEIDLESTIPKSIAVDDPVRMYLMTIPLGGGLVLSHRLNAQSEQMIQARLDVSNAVETLMAEGIAAVSYTHLERRRPTAARFSRPCRV